jgi:phosphoribosylglycinamide formyltransferase 1
VPGGGWYRAAVRVSVLASGSGTILDALLDAGVEVQAVLVDRACGATEVAARHGVESRLVARDRYDGAFDRVAYTDRLIDELESVGTDLVVMAGFGTILAKAVFDRWPGAILNTHPALLPAFPGWHAVADALDYGVKLTGCTVHVATEEVDAGPILAQAAVAVVPGDTVESLHERIKAVERELYVQTIRDIVTRGSV